MFCSKCGSELPDNANFCVNCGAAVNTNLQSKPSMRNDTIGQGSLNMPFVPAKAKSRLEMRKILITVLTVFFIIGILATVIHTVKLMNNKSEKTDVSSNGCFVSSETEVNNGNGMIQPGATSLNELIDTLATKYLLSDASIEMMSNEMLCWMDEEFSSSDAFEFYTPDVLSGEPRKIREAIELYLKNSLEDDYYEYDTKLTATRIVIEDTKPTEIEEGWYDEIQNDESERRKSLYTSEMNNLQAIYNVSGSLKTKDGIMEAKFDFDDMGLRIIKVNNRFYWSFIEMF